MDTSGTDELFVRAREGDEAAWADLIERYNPLLSSVARGYRLTAGDVADVVQTVWLRLMQHTDNIVDPRRLPGWLCITLRRECWRLTGHHGREVLTAEAFEWQAHPGAGPETQILTDDLSAHVRKAVDGLPERQRLLLRALMADPAPSYDEVAATLHMPIGSIGPTRARALAGLRQNPLLRELSYAA